jgi:hypothetical protein
MPTKKPTTRTEHVTKVVDHIIALDADCKHYLVEITQDMAVDWSNRSPVCNRLLRNNLVAMVDYINKTSPKQNYGKGNPNTGSVSHTFKVGNEFSRIVYVVYKKPYCKLDETAWLQFAVDILARAKNIGKPDEAIMESNTNELLTLRFWWD